MLPEKVWPESYEACLKRQANYCPLWTLAVCNTALLGESAFLPTIGPSFELSPFGRISDNPKSLLPTFWASEEYQKWRQGKGSKTSPASQQSTALRCLRCLSLSLSLSHGRFPHQPAECQTKVGCRHVDALNRQFRYRACARSAGGRTDQTHRGETSVLLVPLHRVLCAFDGQHPMLSGEITLLPGRAWAGVGWA